MNSKTSKVDAAEFAAAIKKVSAVLKPSAIPEVENICVEFADGVCRLKGTDLTVYVTTEIPADGDDFSFVFTNTANVVRACGHYRGELRFELWGREREKKLTVRTEDKAGEFPVSDTALYPDFPMEEPTERYTARADQLYQRTKRVSYASKDCESTHALPGVRFEGNHIWCLDGMRVAVSDDETLNVRRRFVLPAKKMEFLKLMGRSDVDIAVSGKYVLFSGNGLSLLYRQLLTTDQLSPETIFPKTSRESYYVDRTAYLESLRYLGEMTRRSGVVYVHFQRGTMSVYDKYTDSRYSARIETDGDCQIAYRFDLRFMREALGQFAGEKYLRFDVCGEMQPIVISGESGMKALILTARLRAESESAAA